MVEFKIKIGLPEDIGYSDLAKKANKSLHDGVMKVQREFIESCSLRHLEVLFLQQDEKESTCLSLIKKELVNKYDKIFLDKEKEFGKIVEFLLSEYLWSDEEGKLALFKKDFLSSYLQSKTIEDLSILYFKLFSDADFDNNLGTVINSMTKIITEKLDEKTSIGILNKILSANVENDVLENFIKEKFKIVRA